MVTGDNLMHYLTNACGEETGRGTVSADEHTCFGKACGEYETAGHLAYYVELVDDRRGLLVCDELWHTDSHDEEEVREVLASCADDQIPSPNGLDALSEAVVRARDITSRIPGSEPFISVMGGPHERHIAGAFLELAKPRGHYRFHVSVSGMGFDPKEAWENAKAALVADLEDPPPICDGDSDPDANWSKLEGAQYAPSWRVAQ